MRLSHVCVCDYRRDMDRLIGFIDHLYRTTSSYSAIADLHILLITTCYFFSQTAASPSAVRYQRLLTLQISQLPARISRKWTHSADLVSSLYNLGTDSKENTASNNFSNVLMGGCLVESSDIVDVFADCHQVKHVYSKDRCVATVLFAAIYKYVSD
jgi:hypothetical protein